MPCAKLRGVPPPTCLGRDHMLVHIHEKCRPLWQRTVWVSAIMNSSEDECRPGQSKLPDMS